jgi:4-azaleucine resistance transporter AzlC
MTKKETIRYALIKALPVMISYLFIGMAYGILMTKAGFGIWWALGISLAVYTGAFQFILVSLLSQGASLVTIALTALFMNSRQTFYGLSFLDDFNAMGKKRWYMIHSLTDETYAIDCTLSKDSSLPVNDRRAGMFYVALFSHLSWAAATVLGSIFGSLIPYDLTGIDFCMTALFVTIFIDQWKTADSHFPALCGLCIAIILCVLLGPDKFMLPSLALTCAVLLFRRTLRKEELV